MPDSSLKNLYQDYTTAALIAITDNPAGYTPEAVTAAAGVLKGRNVDADTLRSIRATQAANRIKREASLHTYKSIERKAGSILTTVNPFATGAATSQRLISCLIIIYGYFAVMRLYIGIRFIYFPIPDREDWAVYYVISNIISAIFLPAVVMLFALRKRIGWFLLCYHLFTSLLSSFVFILTLSNLLPNFGIHIVDNKVFAIAKALLWMVFYALGLYCLYRNDVRGIFRINKKAAVLTPVIIIVLQVFLSGLAWVLSYYYNY